MQELNNPEFMAEKARQLEELLKKQELIQGPTTVEKPAGPEIAQEGVQVGVVRAPGDRVYLEFSRPVERLSLTLEQTREMIGRMRDLVNGIEPARKKHKR